MGIVLPHVPWFLPVGVYIIVAYVGVRWLSKHLANAGDQTKRLTINYGFAAALAGAFALATGSLMFDRAFFMTLAIGGFLNAVAVKAQWKAAKISLSRTSLLSFGDDIIAMLLAALVLGDHRYLNAQSGFGVLICVATGVLLWLHGRKREGESGALYRAILTYSICWGLASFAIRYFAFSELPVGEFIFAWYLGSFLAMAASLVWERSRVPANQASLPAYSFADYAWVALLALGIASCLAIEYWALSLAPATAVMPVLLVAEAIVPTIVGLLVFKEATTFDRTQWALAALGVAGTFLIATGMHLT